MLLWGASLLFSRRRLYFDEQFGESQLFDAQKSGRRLAPRSSETRLDYIVMSDQAIHIGCVIVQPDDVRKRQTRRCQYDFHVIHCSFNLPTHVACTLGLSIARSIARAHGGGLWVTSQPGQGSVFHFALPAVKEPA